MRLIPNSWVDNSSIFEDVFKTGFSGEEENQRNKKERKLIDLSLNREQVHPARP